MQFQLFFTHRSLTYIALCVLILIFLPLHGQAQRESSISISKTVIDIGGEQGDSLESTFRVTNNSGFVLPISIGLGPATSNAGIAIDSGRSIKTHTSIKEPQFILEPEEVKIVSVRVELPEDLGPGGYYADIITRALVLDDASGITTSLPELTTSLFVSVEGGIEESHATKSLQSGLSFLKPEDEIIMRFSVTNTGNIHSLFTPELFIKDSSGNEIKYSESPVLLLPTEETVLSYSISSEDLSRGVLHDSELRYTFGSPAQTASVASSSVIVLPFSLTWILVFLAVIIFMLLYLFRQRIIHAAHILLHGDREKNNT